MRIRPRHTIDGVVVTAPMSVGEGTCPCNRLQRPSHMSIWVGYDIEKAHIHHEKMFLTQKRKMECQSPTSIRKVLRAACTPTTLYEKMQRGRCDVEVKLRVSCL